MRGKRAALKLYDDSFDNWCMEHEEEVNEILQSFIKVSKNVETDKYPIIYVSLAKEESNLW